MDGEELELVVHRKGATRAFAPGDPELPAIYRDVGQPVIIGGSMETGSALLLGTAGAMSDTFGSTAHGSGRTMSRSAAKKKVRGEALVRSMEERGIVLRAASHAGVAEEAGFAYKDLGSVVSVLETIGNLAARRHVHADRQHQGLSSRTSAGSRGPASARDAATSPIGTRIVHHSHAGGLAPSRVNQE